MLTAALEAERRGPHLQPPNGPSAQAPLVSIGSLLPVLLDLGRVDEDLLLWALVLGKDTRKNVISYMWQKQVY